MMRLHSEAHFRHALFALQGPDGYVESLFEMARERAAGRRPLISNPPQARLPTDPKLGAVKGLMRAH